MAEVLQDTARTLGFTRAFTMSPRERTWIIDKLILAGHTKQDVLNAVDHNKWGDLPLLDSYCSDLTCHSCGQKAWRDDGGRIHRGCHGLCSQKLFADLKDDAVEARANALRAAQKPQNPERDFW